jgi:hypothetical protein
VPVQAQAYHLLFPGNISSEATPAGRTPETPRTPADSEGGCGGGGGPKRAEETWLLLEYCDMGSLMVRLLCFGARSCRWRAYLLQSMCALGEAVDTLAHTRLP